MHSTTTSRSSSTLSSTRGARRADSAHTQKQTQVSFAFEEPRKQAAQFKASTFKVALVASDCLLLGAAQTVTSRNSRGLQPLQLAVATSVCQSPQQPSAVVRAAVSRSYTLHTSTCVLNTPYSTTCLLRRTGLQPVLVHLSKNDKGKFSFNPLSVNLMTEVFKVVFALVVLLVLVRGQQEKWHSCGSSSGGSSVVCLCWCRTCCCRKPGQQ